MNNKIKCNILHDIGIICM